MPIFGVGIRHPRLLEFIKGEVSARVKLTGKIVAVCEAG